MPVYNKLVRDRIPEIIEKTGANCLIRYMEDNEYKKELKRKLHEELEEYKEAKNDADALEELADMLEIIHALAISHGVSFEELDEIRLEKAEKRGGFLDKIFLIEVKNE
ncbi:nucleoside triphosphate pyrophosphohydrolase [Alkalihalobacillus trypoxylicola]|uniref:Phosphoribosyl-ATP pyrophosphohydrolase n=1 Tax=Alkalihalobacillus trypoxylicola TaxID=519424 RepID=A0A162D4Q5_9BACI|nr:nucleoside triphosphate pyrophosphohydrolase [Alkalihalobacillus trypoxylicola]KYG28096.1 phosphoribosyl-ATP pyrophosphohydrolase [Alkalihalobacillus trypoxylicola]